MARAASGSRGATASSTVETSAPQSNSRRQGAESVLLLISEVVARLKAGMYGGLADPKPVAGIKANIKKANIKKGERRPSIEWEWQPQKEGAAERIYEAIVQGKLSVFVLPDSVEGEVQRAPLQVPLVVLKQMMTTRAGLPDRVIQPMRILAKDSSVALELLAALSSKSKLYLRRKEFEAWYEEARKKRNWPSQRPHHDTPPSLRSRSKKNPIGRPTKQSGLRTRIVELVNEGRWSAEQNFITDLVRLLKSEGKAASRQTVGRAVEQLHRETGDHRYYYADPRKKPDDSVWGSFEDLMERRRRQHLK
jgi:hypothetical protein